MAHPCRSSSAIAIAFICTAAVPAFAGEASAPAAAPDPQPQPTQPTPSTGNGDRSGAESPASDAEEEKKLEAELSKELGPSVGGASQSDAGSEEKRGGESAAARMQEKGYGSKKLLPNISAIFTGLAGWYSDTPTLRPDGHDPSSKSKGLSFQLQELELAFQSYIDPFMRADIFLSAGLDGIEIEEGYFTTLSLPANLQLKGGEMYAPFGRFNRQHFLETQPFVDAPLPNRRFIGSEQLRGFGFDVSWLAPTPWFLQLEAYLAAANTGVGFGVPMDETRSLKDFVTVGRVEQFFPLTDTWSLTWGVSGAQGANDTGGSDYRNVNRTRMASSDLYIKWRDLESLRYVAITAEYTYRRAVFPDGHVDQGGLYAQIEARVSKHWEVATRGDAVGAPSKLYGSMDFQSDQLPFMVPARQLRGSVALSFYASEFQRWRLQYNIDHWSGISASERAQAGPNVPADLATSRRAVHEVFLQYQFVMGSHGAHPF